LACVGISILLMLFALPGLQTVARQVRLVAPPNVFYPNQDENQRVFDHLKEAKGAWAARVALQVMAVRKAPFQTLLQARVNDPENSLYDFLELLAALREGREDEQLIDQMKHATQGDPCRLRVWDQQEALFAGFAEIGYGRREAAGYVPYWLDRSYRPVLRELVKRLKGKAEAWRQAGRDKEAGVAEACRRGLVEGVLCEQRMPEVALFGARLVGDMADEAGDKERVKKAEAYVAAWHEISADEERVNILPHTGQYEVAYQGWVLTSFTGAVTGLYCWLVLSLLCLYWGVVAFVTRRNGAEAYVEAVGWKVLAVRGVLFCGLWLLLMAILLAVFQGSFSWVVSLPTVPALLLLPTWVWPMVHGCTRLGCDKSVKAVWPRLAGLWLLIGLAGLVFVVFMVWLMSGSSKLVTPPAGVLYFRFLGMLGGFALLVFSVTWALAEWRSRIKAGWPTGVFARMYLRTGAWCLLVLTILTCGVLFWNAVEDSFHESAFDSCSFYQIEFRTDVNRQRDYFGFPE